MDMARAIYIVLHSRQRWWVDFEGRAYGTFTSKELAKTEAISMARFMSHAGKSTEVRVPDDTGKWWMEWESETDPKWSRWRPGIKPVNALAGGIEPAVPLPPRAAPQVRIPGSP